MSKYAAIDIGTNSMRLLLAVIEEGRVVHREKYLQTTRIGKAVDSEGKITTEGIEKNLKAFNLFVNQAKAWGAEEIWAIATSAVRDAANGVEFAKRAEEITGVKIAIITGKEEALLGYKGVLMGLRETEARNFIVDIGGGSTEFILGNQDGIIKADSYNVGALRMTERYIKNDPPTNKEISELIEGITVALEGYLKGIKEDITEIIAIGGTATTMASLHQELLVYDMEKVHGYRMSYHDVVELKNKLEALSIEERRRLRGIEPNRADIIYTGISIMLKIMELLGIGYLSISEYDNLEGLLNTNAN